MTDAPISKADLLKPRIRRINLDGGYVLVKPLTAAYALTLRGQTLADAAIFEMLSHSLCDEAGTEIMTPEEIGSMPLDALNQIVKGVLEFNGITEGVADADLKKTELPVSPMS